MSSAAEENFISVVVVGKEYNLCLCYKDFGARSWSGHDQIINLSYRGAEKTIRTHARLIARRFWESPMFSGLDSIPIVGSKESKKRHKKILEATNRKNTRLY